MTEKVETRPTPPGLADERTTLLAFLDLYRQTMVMKVEGLDESQARWRPTEPANSLLALIRHLTGVERNWFQQVIAGLNVERERDDEFLDREDVPLADAVAAYRSEWDRSNEAMAGVASLSDPCKGEPGFSVRWVLLHMIEETARHAGHADITRELIDGTVGF